MIHSMTTHVPPGWHPDPTDGLKLRYWNGTDWTEDTRPRPPATSAPTGDVPAPADAADRQMVTVMNYLLAQRIMFVLGAIGLIIFGFLAFSGITVRGTKCGSVFDDNLFDLVKSSAFYPCKDALDGRGTWVGVAIVAALICFVVGFVIGAMRRRVQTALSESQIG